MRTPGRVSWLLVALLTPGASGQDAPVGVSKPAVATAANGMVIPDPTSRATTTATEGGRTLAIPEGMVYVAAGPATIGTGADEKTVDIPGFAIGRFSVTNAEYAAFVAATGTRTPKYWKDGKYPEGKANHPVAFVSLVNARAYAAWVGKETGWKVAIPTADQWEKAARGPRGTLYPWGDEAETSYKDGVLTTRFNYMAVLVAPLLRDEPDRKVIYTGRNSTHAGEATTVSQITAFGADGRATRLALTANGSVRGWNSHATGTGFTGTDLFKAINDAGGNTTPVGAYEAGKSGYGAYDMAGNIWNWCDSTVVATNGVERGKTVHEIRGGSWYSYARSCRATTIGEGRAEAGAYNTVGFRIIMIPAAQP